MIGAHVRRCERQRVQEAGAQAQHHLSAHPRQPGARVGLLAACCWCERLPAAASELARAPHGSPTHAACRWHRGAGGLARQQQVVHCIARLHRQKVGAQAPAQAHCRCSGSARVLCSSGRRQQQHSSSRQQQHHAADAARASARASAADTHALCAAALRSSSSSSPPPL